ncbi:hypothetical protein COR50_09065 [Chitinophaga caeni]|uniref:PKD domain-containing protein n=1 Tax=Chitinophaga caeni TaxID=2029983 RepID=A0A291QTL9_9BACT|nr:hypothetical protein COR50_09065 [Chitinophaga caeni]
MTLVALPLWADHVVGGEMVYRFISSSGGNTTYLVQLKLFIRCDAETGQIDGSAPISAIDMDNGSEYTTESAKLRSNIIIDNSNSEIDPCIISPPKICYRICTYETRITLPDNVRGYTLAYQRCCRRAGLTNIISMGNTVGGTYSAFIPANSYENNSPFFDKEKVVIMCSGKPFTYDYHAADPDGDSLVYKFVPAYTGGSANVPSPDPASNPPYYSVQYQFPFSAAQPLGRRVKIDSSTGLISGDAPTSGLYIVTVAAEEYRNGIKLGEHRKELMLSVTNCVKQVVAAVPVNYPDFYNCKSYTIDIPNLSTPDKTYYWNFGDGDTLVTNEGDIIQHTYADTGVYKVVLKVDPISNCSDSTTFNIIVFPENQFDITTSGLCLTKPTNFQLNASIAYGAIDSLAWNFGDGGTSDQINPIYQYNNSGNYNVSVFTQTTKGCKEMVRTSANIYNKPPLTASADTVLCKTNSLQVSANSNVSGTYFWSPNYAISDLSINNPIITPLEDTTYTVTFTDDIGCVATKDIFIDVRDTLLISAGLDSLICTGDPINLHGVSDGPYGYVWKDLNTQNTVSNSLETIITPTSNTNYELTAMLGTCRTVDTVSFSLIDPPRAFAGLDTSICYGTVAHLNASGGAFYQWQPADQVANANLPNTITAPVATTNFTVSVTDTLGCPKAVLDSVLVTVIPPVEAFAGNDTIIIRGQPFQLNATGGTYYSWSPINGLSDPNIANPFTTINQDFTYTVTAYTPEGCNGSDDIFIRFITGPDMYVPTAFSPNGDGRNDVFRPVPVGITQLKYFRVFDRWGKLVFETNAYMQGWDGFVGGKKADAATYTWLAEGLDINGKTIQRKGYVVLLR